MARQGGLGRGLSSLIPQRKEKKTKKGQIDGIDEINFFGANENVITSENSKNTKNQLARKKGETLWHEEENKQGYFTGIALKSIIEVPTDRISPNPYQPRGSFNEEKLQELANSIKKHGILQPLVVSQQKGGQYELIAGERRLEASKIAGLEKVPVIIKEATSADKLEMALIENIQRHNLNPIEEARAYEQLKNDFGLTQNEIAERVGKSRSAVANALRLLGLPIEIQRALIEGKISEGHAKTILAIDNPEKQRALFNLILRDNLSVRQTERKTREVFVTSHRRKMRPVDPVIKAREEQLEEQLATKVRIKGTLNNGQIVIDFYSKEEFDGVFNKLTSR